MIADAPPPPLQMDAHPIVASLALSTEYKVPSTTDDKKGIPVNKDFITYP